LKIHLFKKNKKILLLGGSYAQVPAIKAAKERGLYTILCDYLPDNPGQNFADEYINVSTTDKEKILEIAREREVDYIWAYASDPASPTAAYVSEKLCLPGNSYESVKTLSEKHLFRQLLSKTGLPSPKSLSFAGDEIHFPDDIDLLYPLIVKPVDSSGSRGVTLINSISEFKEAATYALSFSRSNRIIVEEFVDNLNGDLHGDGFVVDGKLKFMHLGDHIYNKRVNPYNPCGTIWPSKLSMEIQNEIEAQVQIIISEAGYENGPINIEARKNKDNLVYIMEIGPRNGGHFVPQAIEYATGFDMVASSIEVMQGNGVMHINRSRKPVVYYALHSEHEGELIKMDISSIIEPFIKEYHQYIDLGTRVKSFRASNAALGILLMEFPTIKIMHDIMSNIAQYVSIEVRENVMS